MKNKINSKSQQKSKITLKIKALLMLGLVLGGNLLGLASSVKAYDTPSDTRLETLYSTGTCNNMIAYKGVPVTCYYTEYDNAGTKFPAYCIEKHRGGVEDGSYDVKMLSNCYEKHLWAKLVYGYPYKSIEELGVKTKEEAFLATKQAIYCYYGNHVEQYTPLNEAGERVVKAINKIYSEAIKTEDRYNAPSLTINRISSEWKIDKKDSKYVSKTYSVTASDSFNTYDITVNETEKGIKIVDMEGKEKKTFKANETFKALVPIRSMKEEKTGIKINAYASIKTLPVYYGVPTDLSKQTTLLATGSYEDGFGEINDEYLKNKTKIIITKQDKDTKKTMEGVEFQILDANKKVILSGCKTDNKGQIVFENMLPGTYYVEEFKTINGYTKYDELIKVDLELNEEARVLVYNNKEVIVHTEGNIESDIVVSNKEVEQKVENKKETNSTDKTVTNKEITNKDITNTTVSNDENIEKNTKIENNKVITNNKNSSNKNEVVNNTITKIKTLPVAGM